MMNKPKAEILDVAFTVGDARTPHFEWEGADLVTLRFLDYRSVEVTIIFEGVCEFRWSECEGQRYAGERFDAVHRIVDSDLVEELARQKGPLVAERLQHFKLNFNGVGVLEVVASSMRPKRVVTQKGI